jgi:hypothetical protein
VPPKEQVHEQSKGAMGEPAPTTPTPHDQSMAFFNTLVASANFACTEFYEVPNITLAS